jgi:hypothetical protein
MVPLALGTPDQRLGDPARRRSAASTASSRRTASIPAHGILSSRARSTTVGVFARTRRGPRAARRAARRLRRARSGHAAARAAAARRRGGRGAAGGFRELVAALGDRVVEIELPESARQAMGLAAHDHGGGDGANLSRRVRAREGQLSDALREQLERGPRCARSTTSRRSAGSRRSTKASRKSSSAATRSSRRRRRGRRRRASIPPAIRPSARLWTLTGMPALSLPLKGENGCRGCSWWASGTGMLPLGAGCSW